MQMTVKNKGILSLEMIGKNIKIISSTNKTLVGVEGKVVDETKHSFVLDVMVSNEKQRKQVMKKTIVFQLQINNEIYQVDGKMLEKRPEDRIKIK
jgi:ribonuclease P protein subunit POP4